MSEEYGLTNAGDGVVPVPVELKDHSKDPKLTDDQTETLKRRAEHEDATTKDVIGPMAISPELLSQAKKKRGRPAKKAAEEVKPEKIWYCSTCRETISDHNVMKIGAGTNRWAVFCPQCQRSFGFQDQEVLDKVADLVKNNPTGKNAKA